MLTNKKNILKRFKRFEYYIIIIITTLLLKLDKKNIDLIVYVSYLYNLLNYA